MLLGNHTKLQNQNRMYWIGGLLTEVSWIIVRLILFPKCTHQVRTSDYFLFCIYSLIYCCDMNVRRLWTNWIFIGDSLNRWFHSLKTHIVSHSLWRRHHFCKVWDVCKWNKKVDMVWESSYLVPFSRTDFISHHILLYEL